MHELGWLALLFALIAALYSTVGHAGASGYLAAMALLGVAPAVMRPTALALNVLVAAVATLRFARAGRTDWRALAPLALASVPMAFVGGRAQLPAADYRLLLGCVLLASALVLAWRAMGRSDAHPEQVVRLRWAPALAVGAVIGLLSGLTGTGGGIFLSPLLLFTRRAGPRSAAGLAAPFILVNSLAGLLGLKAGAGTLPEGLPVLAGAVLLGALAGTALGVNRLPGRALLAALALVLAIAGGKLLLPA